MATARSRRVRESNPDWPGHRHHAEPTRGNLTWSRQSKQPPVRERARLSASPPRHASHSRALDGRVLEPVRGRTASQRQERIAQHTAWTTWGPAAHRIARTMEEGLAAASR